jgi:hypothetical protein
MRERASRSARGRRRARAGPRLVVQVAVDSRRRAQWRFDAHAEVAAADAAVDVLALQWRPASLPRCCAAHVHIHGDLVEGLGPPVAVRAPAIVADEVAVGGRAPFPWFGDQWCAVWRRGCFRGGRFFAVSFGRQILGMCVSRRSCFRFVVRWFCLCRIRLRIQALGTGEFLLPGCEGDSVAEEFPIRSEN